MRTLRQLSLLEPERPLQAPDDPAAPGALRGLTWRELVLRIGEEMADGAYEGMPWKEATVRAAYRLACMGNATILKELWQRAEPAPGPAAGSGNEIDLLSPAERRARIAELFESARERRAAPAPRARRPKRRARAPD